MQSHTLLVEIAVIVKLTSANSVRKICCFEHRDPFRQTLIQIETSCLLYKHCSAMQMNRGSNRISSVIEFPNG